MICYISDIKFVFIEDFEDLWLCIFMEIVFGEMSIVCIQLEVFEGSYSG